jgi:hypothetical protein
MWEMNLMAGKNPSHTAQFYNSYDNREFSPSQVLARESGQNAMDAGRHLPELTDMNFHWLRVNGENKSSLLSLLDLKHPLQDRLEAYRENPKSKSFCTAVEKLFSDDEVEFLLIRDFNTCGLGGKWDRYERGDHFARLVCALNLDDKSDGDPNSGGSFGLGKTTYSNSSKIQTVLYHSVFSPSDDTAGVGRRLMTAGVYPSHDFDGRKYGGFAYCGPETETGSGEAMPFLDNEALELWDKICGFMNRDDLKRNEDQHGTDVLIFKPTINFKAVKTAIEDFYWPAIIDRKLHVSLFDVDGEMHHPNPIARKDLKPFINLHHRIKNNEKVDNETLVVEKLRKRREKNTGSVAFEAMAGPRDSNSLINTVALMRNTGMVINYAKLGADRFEQAIGVFVAAEDSYPFLVASENMAHSEWDKNSRRLDREFSEEGKEIIQWINNSIERRFQEFQKNLQPDASASRNEHGFFAQLMSSALKGSKGDSAPDPGPPSPASISLTRKSRIDNLSTWVLKITDNEHTPADEFKLKVKPSFSIAGDAKRIALKRREVLIKEKTGEVIDKGEKPEFEISFQKGSIFEALIELDAPGEHDYVVACHCLAAIEVRENTGEVDAEVNAVHSEGALA